MTMPKQVQRNQLCCSAVNNHELLNYIGTIQQQATASTFSTDIFLSDNVRRNFKKKLSLSYPFTVSFYPCNSVDFFN